LVVPNLHYPDDISAEERAAGFVQTQAGSLQLVATPLGNGLCVVKLRVDGQVQYAICNEQLEPLYPAATSLDELRLRFGL
jgi:hypothetical protein